MSLRIRPFTPEDYPALVAVENAIWPEYPGTVEEWKHWEAHRDPKCKWQRWVAEWDGSVVGYAGYSQSSGRYHPRKFGVGVHVRPDAEGRGIGSALYEQVLRNLEPHDPLLVRTNAREDRPRALRFLASRGFEETMREWESRLDVGAFDPAPHAGAVERVLAQGIEIRTLAELGQDSDTMQKLYDLMFDVEQDIPSPDQPTRERFDLWLEKTLKAPGLLPDAWFVAVDGQEYAGISQLYKPQAGEYLDTGLTGIRRAYRRRGIALALKLKAIDYAGRHGCPEVRTWNATTNEGMLSINVRLGFARQPAWIDYVRHLARE